MKFRAFKDGVSPRGDAWCFGTQSFTGKHDDWCFACLDCNIVSPYHIVTMVKRKKGKSGRNRKRR